MWETIDLDDHEKVVDFLQGQSNRIKELEEREEQLLSEIEDFQELLAKNDNVCHKRVIDLIDNKINIIMEDKNPNLTYTTSIVIAVLEALKKELLE